MAIGDFKQSVDNPYAFDAGIVPEYLKEHFKEFKAADCYDSFYVNNFTKIGEEKVATKVVDDINLKNKIEKLWTEKFDNKTLNEVVNVKWSILYPPIDGNLLKEAFEPPKEEKSPLTDDTCNLEFLEIE